MGKFKVGDRVRVVSDGLSTSGAAGMLGTVKSISSRDWGYPYQILMDDGGSYKSNAVKQDYRWSWFEADALEPFVPLKIEAGKFYKTRDGHKRGPINPYSCVSYPEEKWTDGSRTYRLNGEWNGKGVPDNDLIAEWVDEPAASNDNAAPAKFKVGDRVRLIGNVASYQTLGLEGMVTHVGTSSVEVDYAPHRAGQCTEFFNDIEIVTSATQPTAIVALIENGQPKPATRPYVHATEESATKEAERLALLHPSQEFGVYVLAGSKIADEVITKTAVLRAA